MCCRELFTSVCEGWGHFFSYPSLHLSVTPENAGALLAGFQDNSRPGRQDTRSLPDTTDLVVVTTKPLAGHAKRLFALLTPRLPNLQTLEIDRFDSFAPYGLSNLRTLGVYLSLSHPEATYKYFAWCVQTSA